jgi:hypothetical protein
MVSSGRVATVMTGCAVAFCMTAMLVCDPAVSAETGVLQ